MEAEIRLLNIDDLKAVKELARHIWEGNDYLGKVAKGWIEEGGFLGLFDADMLIGCAKITHLPDGVVWLEGLRIHPEYQHKGLGKELAKTVLDMALQFVQSGEAQHIEFSTYCLNQESIHISTQAGFKPVDEYYILTHKSVKPASPKHFSKIFDNVTDYFPTSLPYGWKFLHPTKQAVNWLNRKVQVAKAEGGHFYVGGEEPTVCLLSPAGEWLDQALPYIQYYLGKKKEIELLLHPSRAAEIPVLQELGFHWWEEGQEDKIIIYRYLP